MFRHHVTYFPYLFMVSLMSLVGHPLQLVRFLSSPGDSTPQRGSASPCPRCRTMTVPALQRLQRRKRGSWCSLETSRAGFTYPSFHLAVRRHLQQLFPCLIKQPIRKIIPKPALGVFPASHHDPATGGPMLTIWLWFKAIDHKRTAYNTHNRTNAHTSNWHPMFIMLEILGCQISILWPRMIK